MAAQTTPERLIPRRQAMEILGFSQSRFDAWRREGRIPGLIHVGRRVFVGERSLARLIDELLSQGNRGEAA